MLVAHLAFCRPFYVLRRDPQGGLRPYELLNRTVTCELVRDFISLYPSMSRDPIRSYCVPGRDIIESLLEISYQWRRCCGSLKNFQSRMNNRENTDIFLWTNIHLNFINTSQDGIYFGLKTVASFTRQILCLLPKDCP